MVEQLSFLSIIVVVVLAISLVIPTRRRTPQVMSQSRNDDEDQNALLQLLYQLAIHLWTLSNTARLKSLPIHTTNNAASLGLFQELLEKSPQDWIDSRSKLLKQSRLVSLCESASQVNQKWCFFAFHCDIQHASTESNSLASDLAYREIAKQWFETLTPFGIVSGSDRYCLLLAVPYTANNEEFHEQLRSIALTMHSMLVECSTIANDSKMPVQCRTKFTSLDSGRSIEETIQLLLNDEDSSSAMRCHELGEWQNLDVPNASNITQFETDEDGNAIVSPEIAAQLVASSKTTPAAVCIKDDSAPVIEKPAVQRDVKSTDKPVESVAEDKSHQESAPSASKPVVAASPELTKQTPRTTPDKASEESTTNSNNSEPAPTDAVSSSDIDELFAIARRRKDQSQATEQEPAGAATSQPSSDEEATLASIKEIQKVAESAQPEPQATELDNLSSTDAVTADDIAKLFAAAKAKG